MFFPATYAIAVTFPKLSILAMYLRIFTVPFYRMVTYFVIYILVASSTILFMMMLFQCTPVNYFWDKSIPGGKCHFDIEKLFLYASLPNITTDVAMLILPLPFVYRLNMTRKVKIGLGLTLLTGSRYLLSIPLPQANLANPKTNTHPKRSRNLCPPLRLLRPPIHLPRYSACIRQSSPLHRPRNQHVHCRRLSPRLPTPLQHYPPPIPKHAQSKRPKRDTRHQRKDDNRRHRAPTNT